MGMRREKMQRLLVVVAPGGGMQTLAA